MPIEWRNKAISLKRKDKSLLRDDLASAAPNRAKARLRRAIFRCMKGRTAAVFAFLIAGAALLSSQTNFENQYVRMPVQPGWTVDASSSPPLVRLIHGKYVLTIDPILVHATAFGGLEDIARGLPSVEAVMAEVDGPWSTSCAQPEKMIPTSRIQLWPLYTEDTKSNIDYGCKFPSDGKPAWFGSYSLGERPESEYIIALAYDSNDVNALPKKGAPELTQVLSDVDRMMKTCELKPPIVISGIEPQSVPPGATVTLHGSGFDLRYYNLRPQFTTYSNLEMLRVKVSPDGTSMTFEVPTSRTKIACRQPGLVNIGENCVLPPPNYVDDCPRVSDQEANFCGVPFPPGVYNIQVTGLMVRSNEVSLTITAPKPTAVLIASLYPNHGIAPGETITVRGEGFTPSGNAVKIGDSVVPNVPSPNGETLTFQAPALSGAELITSGAYLQASVQASVDNAKGQSNSIAFDYFYPGPNALHWQKGGFKINAPPQSVPKH